MAGGGGGGKGGWVEGVGGEGRFFFVFSVVLGVSGCGCRHVVGGVPGAPRSPLASCRTRPAVQAGALIET